jgi:hypothetical protein
LLLALSVWLSPWDYSSSDWAGLTFGVLVTTAFLALRQVTEARRLREDQARPFVIIDFHPWETIIDMTIKNIGATMATGVTFEFDPPLSSTLDERPGRGWLTELNLFKHGIPSLPPGKEVTLLFDQFPSRLERKLPLTYSVDVRYSDSKGKPYRDTITLDLAMYVDTGTVTRHGLHEVHKELKVIADTLKRWGDSDGLKVLTRADIERRNEARMERLAAMERERSGDPPSE